MRVALTVDAVTAPVTGIGRYTLELATRLPALGARMRYLSRGGVLTEERLHARACEAIDAPHARGIYRMVRHALNRSSLLGQAAQAVVDCYGRLSPRDCDSDLVHGTSYYLPDLGGAVKVVSFHDLSPIRFPGWHLPGRAARLAAALRKSASRADWVITDSNAVRAEVLVEFGLPAHRVVAIPLGVDPVFRERGASECHGTLGQFGLRAGGYSLVVGTVEPRKNHDRLLAAYGRLPAQTRRAYPLVIAGGLGWGVAAASKAISRGVEEGWVKFLGFVSSAELPFLYSGAHLFIYPSLYEGFGLPILEAMASGIPAITSNRPSLAEVGEEAVHLVEPEDVMSIFRGIERGLDDQEWREEAIRFGLGLAKRRGWSNCAQNTLALYQHAVSEDGRANLVSSGTTAPRVVCPQR